MNQIEVRAARKRVKYFNKGNEFDVDVLIIKKYKKDGTWSTENVSQSIKSI